MKKQELRKIIKEELTIWEKDMEAAEKIKPELMSIYDKIAETLNLIDKNLSEFNSPGLAAQFVKGIKLGLDNIKSYHDFGLKDAKKELDKYYNRD